MTQKFSAADFANAQFAEHPDTGALAVHLVASEWEHDYEWTVLDDDGYYGHIYPSGLVKAGWVPVIPARTIHDRDVEALCADTASYERDDYLDGFMRGFQQAGGVILDDPEPTNTEQLKQIICESDFKVSDFLGRSAYDSFAKYLNAHGVTAPEGNPKLREESDA